MYKKLSQLNSWKSAAENQLSVTLVLISGAEAGSARSKSFSKRPFRASSFAKIAVRVWNTMAAAWAWAFSARLVRSIGPGRQALERHEFESIELRQGGFGGPF